MQTTTIIQPTHTPHPLFTDIRDIDPGLLMLAVSLMNIDTVHNSARNSLFRDEHLIGTLGKVAPLGGKISAAKNRIIQQELQATNGELSTLSELKSRYVDNATVNETDNQRFSEQKDWAAERGIVLEDATQVIQETITEEVQVEVEKQIEVEVPIEESEKTPPGPTDVSEETPAAKNEGAPNTGPEAPGTGEPDASVKESPTGESSGVPDAVTTPAPDTPPNEAPAGVNAGDGSPPPDNSAASGATPPVAEDAPSTGETIPTEVAKPETRPPAAGVSPRNDVENATKSAGAATGEKVTTEIRKEADSTFGDVARSVKDTASEVVDDKKDVSGNNKDRVETPKTKTITKTITEIETRVIEKVVSRLVTNTEALARNEQKLNQYKAALENVAASRDINVGSAQELISNNPAIQELIQNDPALQEVRSQLEALGQTTDFSSFGDIESATRQIESWTDALIDQVEAQVVAAKTVQSQIERASTQFTDQLKDIEKAERERDVIEQNREEFSQKVDRLLRERREKTPELLDALEKTIAATENFLQDIAKELEQQRQKSEQ